MTSPDTPQASRSALSTARTTPRVASGRKTGNSSVPCARESEVASSGEAIDQPPKQIKDIKAFNHRGHKEHRGKLESIQFGRRSRASPISLGSGCFASEFVRSALASALKKTAL